VRAVAGPGGALQLAGLTDAGDVDGDRVGFCAALVVLGGQEELRGLARVRGLLCRRQDAAGGVEVATLQAVFVEERALQVVAAVGGAEEPVANQVRVLT